MLCIKFGQVWSSFMALLRYAWDRNEISIELRLRPLYDSSKLPDIFLSTTISGSGQFDS